jgi:peroxiredoxin
MLPALCLYACVIATAQPRSADGLNPPQLDRGLELVYTGTYTEDMAGRGVQASSVYRIENRIFVISSGDRGADLAILTILTHRGQASQGHASEPSSVRLMQAHIDRQGTLSAAKALSVPLDAPPTNEAGAFVPMPLGGVSDTHFWEAAEEGRPPRTWRILGREVVNGSRCFKVQGSQQSDDWDQPRSGRVAWRRQDTLWIASPLGLTYRLERTIERRDPLHREPNQRLKLRYDLESRVVYPDRLYASRVRDISQTQILTEAAEACFREPDLGSQHRLEAILAKIAHHLENYPETPYREGLCQLRRRIEAARRGEVVAADAPEPKRAVAAAAAIGQMAPDFVTTDLAEHESIRLKRLIGKPIVLIFYSPASKNAEEVLRFAESLLGSQGDVKVLVLVVSSDAKLALKQRSAWGIKVPVASGAGLRIGYDVEATPKLVVIDRAGIVRGAYLGWGPETPALVTEELARCRDQQNRGNP